MSPKNRRIVAGLSVLSLCLFIGAELSPPAPPANKGAVLTSASSVSLPFKATIESQEAWNAAPIMSELDPVQAWSMKRSIAKRRKDLAALESVKRKPVTKGPSEWYIFTPQTIAPALHETGAIAFNSLTPDPTNAGAAGILRRLIAEHEQSKPLGWEKLVSRVMRSGVEDGELAMVKTADALINETPYVDHTGGVYFSPKRFFERGGAVCKDYANVKYLLLRDAGYPVDRMRIAALMPSANGRASFGHVVLLVEVRGEPEPYALDLAATNRFNEDLKRSGESKLQRMARIKREGLGDPEPRFELNNMMPLRRFNQTAYGGYRGLLATSNEVGSRFFTKPAPRIDEDTTLWTSRDEQTKAVRGQDGTWVLGSIPAGRGMVRRYKLMSPQELEKERLLAERHSEAPTRG